MRAVSFALYLRVCQGICQREEPALSRAGYGLTVSPRGDASGGFSVAIPENWDRGKPRVALAADIMADGQYLGQIAEGVADVQLSS
jgi:hypothetical protein